MSEFDICEVFPILPPPQTVQPVPVIDAFHARRHFEANFLYRTRMCKYIQRDEECPDGDACQFAHDPKDLRFCPNLYKTSLCKFYNMHTGHTSCRRRVCKFAHSLAEMRPDPRYMGVYSCGSFALLNADLSLHTIKRVSPVMYVNSCEHCGKLCRLTPSASHVAPPPPPPHPDF